ncbi:MAG: hypothetical protein NTU99_08415 [Pseudanabaena sp. LacPavin_0818_WC45_MAG_42_6]|nr:hypothetical protein [Pseudanabaena sp. LacPavin_0818_WC45_MAG_42_6]
MAYITNDINETMYDRLTAIAFLKQISADHQNIDRSEIVVPLGDQPITLGRDPICEVAIDINMYGSVSRCRGSSNLCKTKVRGLGNLRSRQCQWHIYQ